MRKSLLILGTLLPCSAFCASEEGTGAPQIQLGLAENQRVILQLQQAGISLVGSQELDQGFAELTLDAILEQEGGILPNWGKAEVVVDCDQADIVVYQQVDSTWQEYATTSITLNGCATQ